MVSYAAASDMYRVVQKSEASASGVTRVGVIRGGQLTVSPLFFLENTDDLFSHLRLQTDDLFSCPTSYRVCPLLFLNSATLKNYSGVTP